MTTNQKREDAEKAALQNEYKYLSGLLEAHFSSTNMNSQPLNGQSSMPRNPAFSTCNGFKTTNHGHSHKSTSFHHRTVNYLPYSKSVNSSTVHKQIPYGVKVSNSFNLKKYPHQSSMVKINPSTSSLNIIKKDLDNNLLKSSNSKQIIQNAVKKVSSSNSQSFDDELVTIRNKLIQRKQAIYKKMNSESSKVLSIIKSKPDKLELKGNTEIGVISAVSKMCPKIINEKRQTIDFSKNNCKDFSNGADVSLPLSKSSNSCVFNKNKELSLGKSPDEMNNSSQKMIKPLEDFKKIQQQSNHELLGIANKPCNKTSQNLFSKVGNIDILQVTDKIKTPIKKKLIKNHPNSVKKLNGTKLFASKYKVVNRKLLCIEQEKKTNVANPEFKTSLEIKPAKKHINSAKKMKSGARLVTTKYKIINKKLPSAKANSKNCIQGTNEAYTSVLPINKLLSSKTKIKKVNSKYKIVNKNGNSSPVSHFAKKGINTKEIKRSNFVHQRRKSLTKFSLSNYSGKNVYFAQKHGERKLIKSVSLLKQNHLRTFNIKRKRLTPSRNSFILSSKYRTVNKPNSTLKKKSELLKSTNIDLDLLMEIAAERKVCSDKPTSNSPSKHILLKRVYKSKNAIVNKNISSLQTKAAKMIKTKYSILNKRHSWQNYSFNKKLISPKTFKGGKFTRIYQRNVPFYSIQKHKRNNSGFPASTYIAGRSYSKGYFSLKNQIGSFRSSVKTPKRFVLNRKAYPNSLKATTPISKFMASRALNRSINRVINASVKKKTSKVNVYCKFYNRFGRCNKGLKCSYVHDPSKIAVCTRFLRGTCKAENCPFSHEICPGKMAICSFFLSGSCTKINCPYRHEALSPNAKLCKAFVEGYCPNGKQCKQAHVLVCPQFVQGHCEKGKACPFPHPPPKEKKTIPNSSEKSENLMEAEELILEKMSRYFECGNESKANGNSSVNSIAVSRKKNLPEQPSFIAL